MTPDNSPNLLTLEFYEDDMWQHIQSKESKQGYIKNLIREDMNKTYHVSQEPAKPKVYNKKPSGMKTYGMNTALGTKWFVFYSVVRPWFVCLTAIGFLADYTKYTAIYLREPFMLAAVISAIVGAVLSVITAIKANGYYGDFVRLVNGVLIFEVVNSAYQVAVRQYYQNGEDLELAGIVLLFGLLIGYFVWYRLNMKYFKNRL